jgi:hypothetical protein
MTASNNEREVFHRAESIVMLWRYSTSYSGTATARFLTSALNWNLWTASCFIRYMPGKKVSGNWKEDGLNLMSDQATNRNLIACPPARYLGTRLTETCRSGFGGLGVSALAFGTQVRGFKPGRSRRIFQGEKILSAPSFRREVKPWVPCRWFMACKRSLDVSWKSASRQN